MAQRIKELRQGKNYTLLELAKKLGVSEGTVQRYESGNIRNLKYDTIVKLAEILDCSPAYLMGWDDQRTARDLRWDLFGDRDPQDHPIYEAAAGEGVINDGYPSETMNLRLDPDQMLFTVKGRSMEPTLQDGDTVVVTIQSVIDYPRQLALVRVNGDESTIKRVEIKEDGLLLIGDNLDVYAPHFFTSHEVQTLPVTIYGVVKRLIRDID